MLGSLALAVKLRAFLEQSERLANIEDRLRVLENKQNPELYNDQNNIVHPTKTDSE